VDSGLQLAEHAATWEWKEVEAVDLREEVDDGLEHVATS
jgi:hypothetical protein